MGVAATLLTTWVLHVYHSPSTKQVSAAYQRFTKHVTLPFFNLTHRFKPHRYSKCSQRNQVEPKTQKPMSKKFKSQEIPQDVADNTDCSTSYELFLFNWFDVAGLMDHFFLWVFGFALVNVSVVILGILYAEY